jgi:hypothetical protein
VSVTLLQCVFSQHANSARPELRNQIYDYAVETDDYHGSLLPAPLVSLQGEDTTWHRAQHHESARIFFGLTQVCKQLRSEYQPIWLRGSVARVKLSSVSEFLQTFYPDIAALGGPKRLQISWAVEDYEYDMADYHDSDYDKPLPLMDLFRLRAHCNTTEVEFVAMGGEGEPCQACIGDMEDMVSDGEDPSEYDYVNCRHGDWYLDWCFGYLVSLNKLLANDNAEWLSAIREGRINDVSLVANYQSRWHELLATIRICFARPNNFGLLIRLLAMGVNGREFGELRLAVSALSG